MKSLNQRIIQILADDPDVTGIIDKIADKIEAAVKEWDKEQYEMMHFKPVYTFWHSEATHEQKKLSVRVDCDNIIYKVRIAENDLILLEAQVLKP